MLPTSVFLVFLNFCLLLITNANAQDIDQLCMHCLCQAMSDCAQHTCEKAAIGPVCGPFRLSKPYWVDGGKEGDGPNDDAAFESCAKDTQCAERTIRGYMSKYGKNCNNDNIIDCEDFVRIHIFGPYSCEEEAATSNAKYRKFDQCYYNSDAIDLRKP